MNAENIQVLTKSIKGKVSDAHFSAISKRLVDIDDNQFTTIKNIVGQFKSPGLAQFLTFIGYLGMAYIGKIGRTVTYWILAILIPLFPFILAMVAPLFGDDFANDKELALIIGSVFSVGMGLVLFVWWLFDIFGIRKNVYDINFKKLAAVLKEC